jgi:hypothetical protein
MSALFPSSDDTDVSVMVTDWQTMSISIIDSLPIGVLYPFSPQNGQSYILVPFSGRLKISFFHQALNAISKNGLSDFPKIDAYICPVQIAAVFEIISIRIGTFFLVVSQTDMALHQPFKTTG